MSMDEFIVTKGPILYAKHVTLDWWCCSFPASCSDGDEGTQCTGKDGV